MRLAQSELLAPVASRDPWMHYCLKRAFERQIVSLSDYTMPSIPIHPRSTTTSSAVSALPQLLRTPSGLAIVEIQGTVKSSSPTQPPQDGSADGSSSIGKLIFPSYDETKPVEDTSWQKRVHLYVGKHQRLTGEVKKLANPIAVLRRRTNHEEHDELEIAEIVYYKLLFAHRPEPVGTSGSNE